MMQKRKCGFTLVELILILLILGVAAAFIFPIFVSWRTQAKYNERRSACQSNLKQMALGIHQYANDHSEKFPNSGVLSASRDDGWVRALQPYVKSYQKFQCPADEWKLDETTGSKLVTDYYYNSRLSGVSWNQIELPGYNIVMIGEGEPASSNYACTDLNHCVGQSLNGPVRKVPQAVQKRHWDSVTYAFLDGHIQSEKPGRINVKTGEESLNYGFTLRK